MPAAIRLHCFLIIAAVLAGSAAAKVVHPTPKNTLKRRRPSANKQNGRPRFVPTLNTEQQDYLRAHNDIRKSMNIPPLAWDPKLAAVAHTWAEKRRGDCDHRSHSNSPYGENIFMMRYREFTPRDVVEVWFKESKMYDSRAHQCRCVPEREGCECGHFLNVVWRTTKRVGCSGLVYCDKQRGVYVVCEYDPPGLLSGVNPFTGLRLT